jgi:type I restriction enzyme S subunit
MHFKVGKKLIQNASTNSMKGIVNKNKFGNIPFLNPPIIEQNKFEKIFKTVELMKSKMGISLSKINDIFNSLFQRAFKGELEFNDVYFDKMEKENRELI